MNLVVVCVCVLYCVLCKSGMLIVFIMCVCVLLSCVFVCYYHVCLCVIIMCVCVLLSCVFVCYYHVCLCVIIMCVCVLLSCVFVCLQLRSFISGIKVVAVFLVSSWKVSASQSWDLPCLRYEEVGVVSQSSGKWRDDQLVDVLLEVLKVPILWVNVIYSVRNENVFILLLFLLCCCLCV